MASCGFEIVWSSDASCYQRDNMICFVDVAKRLVFVSELLVNLRILQFAETRQYIRQYVYPAPLLSTLAVAVFILVGHSEELCKATMRCQK